MRPLTIIFPQKYIRLFLLLAGLVASLVLWEEVVDDVFDDPLEGDLEALEFDKQIFSYVNELRSPILTKIMTGLTHLGSFNLVVGLVIIVLVALLFYRKFKGIVYFIVLAFGAGTWPRELKPFFGRERPDDLEHLVSVWSLSFPSGHSFAAAAVYIGLAYYFGLHAKSWKWEICYYAVAILIICAVGASRVYLGVHFPTDVFAGLSGGAAWAFLVSAVFECCLRSRYPLGGWNFTKN